MPEHSHQTCTGAYYDTNQVRCFSPKRSFLPSTQPPTSPHQPTRITAHPHITTTAPEPSTRLALKCTRATSVAPKDACEVHARAASKRRTLNVTPHALGKSRGIREQFASLELPPVPVRCKLCFMCHKRSSPVPGGTPGGRGAALCRGVTGDTAVSGQPDLEHAVEPLPRATADADPHAYEHDENQHRDREYIHRRWRHRKSDHGHHTHRTMSDFFAWWGPRRTLTAAFGGVSPKDRGQLWTGPTVLRQRTASGARGGWVGFWPNTLTACPRRSKLSTYVP